MILQPLLLHHQHLMPYLAKCCESLLHGFAGIAAQKYLDNLPVDCCLFLRNITKRRVSALGQTF